jgi:hypothetical protein
VAGALIGLEALLGVSGLFLIFDGVIALSIVALAAGLLLALLAVSLRAGEAAHAWSASRAVVPFLLLPVVLMAAQLIPFPPLAHSVWSAAAAALNEPLSGSITIDTGATAVALCRYLALVAIVIVSLCVSVNRRQADGLLRVMTAIGLVLSLAMLIALFAAPGFAAATGLDFRVPLVAIASLGVLLSATSIVRWVEQLDISRGKGAPGPTHGRSDVTTNVIALTACFAVVMTIGSRTAWLALLCSLLPLVAVPLIRRFVSRLSVIRAAMGVIVLLAVAVLAIHLAQGTGEAAVRIAAGADASQIGLAQRMLGDGKWLGSGAGTYSAVVPLYRSLADPAAVSIAPTAAAALALELGNPALALFAVLALGLAALLFDRALRRGRDSFYPALGGAGLILMTFGMFADNALLGTTVAVLSASIAGLALGQSLSMRQMLE